MLWFALHFPRFALDVLARGQDPTLPCVIVEQQRIVLGNEAAARAGISPGMGLQAALALTPDLQQLTPASHLEQQALERLAGWCLQFTSQVSLEPPSGLLLEVGGSLRLFGGLPALRQRMTSGLRDLGYLPWVGIASTPRAAWLLALANDGKPVLDQSTLLQRLASLPWRLLDLSTPQQQALQGLGISTLGDCLALPRGALGRRLGKALLLQLEQALGERPEPRRCYRPPPTYHGYLEFPAEAREIPSILFALQRLLREFCGYLRGMETGVQSFSLALRHPPRGQAHVTIGLLEPSRDAQRLLTVARERLERETLAGPVDALTLMATAITPLPFEECDLLEKQNVEGSPDWQRLAERLTARLGDQAVSGLATSDDHRPEKAWSRAGPGERIQQHADPHRPLWLLKAPRPLQHHQGRPCWNGPLVLHQGPERLESGWWDGQDIARDYYMAHASNGSLLWIYRERRPPGHWFLHGFFA